MRSVWGFVSATRGLYPSPDHLDASHTQSHRFHTARVLPYSCVLSLLTPYMACMFASVCVHAARCHGARWVGSRWLWSWTASTCCCGPRPAPAPRGRHAWCVAQQDPWGCKGVGGQSSFGLRQGHAVVEVCLHRATTDARGGEGRQRRPHYE